MSDKLRVGIDVGGTFTDIVGIDQSGKLTIAKTLTTPGDLAVGVLTGINKLVRITKLSNNDVGLIIHGTTIGTNALLERKGVKTGLLTTAGFRDILEIGRVQRPPEGLYDFNADNPEPLIPRRYRLEAVERIDSKGNVIIPLNESSVAEAARYFKKENINSISICFLFSFINPKHEIAAREILQRELPEAYISISSDIAPEFREYERTSTVVINSYIGPLIDNYVTTLEERVCSAFPSSSLRLIQANGGSMRAAAAKGRSVNLVNSGPAGGATATAFLSRVIDVPRIIGTDMGGTSFDISLIDEGTAHVTTDAKFEGYPIKVPMCEVTAIGAGGGSIAWVDSGGALNVGPQSASAVPGPVCYNRGGKSPTVTDANVVLGRLNPDYPLGGEIKPAKGLAEESIAKAIGENLSFNVEESAWSILRVINARMAKAISVHTTQKGYDLREFALLSFGGAGPLHAVEISKELGIPRVIVPPYPGVFSAVGLLIADARYDFVRALHWEQSLISPSELWNVFCDLTQMATDQLQQDGIDETRRLIHWSADLKYEGQSYELNVPIGENLYLKKKVFSQEDIQHIGSNFADLHERIYAIKSLGEKTYFVNLRVAAIGKSPEFALPHIQAGTENPAGALTGRRKVYFGSWTQSDIYERQLLRAGNIIKGPAIVEEESSCTVIPPGSTAKIDSLSNIIISV